MRKQSGENLTLKNSIDPFPPFLLDFHRFGSAAYFDLLRLEAGNLIHTIEAACVVLVGRDRTADAQVLEFLANRSDAGGNVLPYVGPAREQAKEDPRRPLLLLVGMNEGAMSDYALHITANMLAIAFVSILNIR